MAAGGQVTGQLGAHVVAGVADHGDATGLGHGAAPGSVTSAGRRSQAGRRYRPGSGRAPSAPMSSGTATRLPGMQNEQVVATTTIEADPEAVFAVLADPSTHADIDGTGWVREPLGGDRITAAGQVFRMAMHHENHPDGDYEMANRVEVFDEPTAIGWQPGQESPETGELSFGGWTWRYDLEPTGPSWDEGDADLRLVRGPAPGAGEHPVPALRPGAPRPVVAAPVRPRLLAAPYGAPVPTPSALATALLRSGRATWVEPVGVVALGAPVHHPQGMVRAGDLWWLSTVDIEAVRGHLLAFDDDGELVADVDLLDGPRFHPGGIDVVGGVVVVPVAEYRPDSTTALFRVDLATGAADLVGRVDDHVGALSTPRPDGTATALTWGSRRVLTLDTEGTVLEARPNPSHWIDVQDCQRLDDRLVLCSGIGVMADGDRLVGLGGLAVWDEAAATWVHELPLATTVASGRILTTNPVWAEEDGGDVVLHAAPDDHDGTRVTHRLHTAS